MKEETASIPITEFIGIRSKLYSFTCADDHSKQTLKGVKRSFVKNHINHQNYVEAITNEKPLQTAKFQLFRSQGHVINTYTTNKTSICNWDDKKYILQNGISSHSHGHYKTKFF